MDKKSLPGAARQALFVFIRYWLFSRSVQRVGFL
jgi:hypothetical protein